MGRKPIRQWFAVDIQKEFVTQCSRYGIDASLYRLVDHGPEKDEVTRYAVFRRKRTFAVEIEFSNVFYDEDKREILQWYITLS